MAGPACGSANGEEIGNSPPTARTASSSSPIQTAKSFEPEFGDEASLRWWLSQFLFDGDAGPLSVEDQQTLTLIELEQQFFPTLRRTRVIAAHVGPQGSGKTTGMRLRGRLLVGPRFDVTGLRADKEDAFIAAVTNSAVCGFDNADSRIKWLEDHLATYATGQRYSLRQLYATNGLVRYDPRAYAMISSRDPQFRRPDVAERLMVLRFRRPEKYLGEEKIFAELERRRGAILGALLTCIGRIADKLESVEAPALPFRMADFASFGWRVVHPYSDRWLELLGRVEAAQASFAAMGSVIVEILSELLEKCGGQIGPISTSDLHKDCLGQAKERPFPRTVQSFGQRLTNMRRVLELELDIEFYEERGHAGQRIVTLRRAVGSVMTAIPGSKITTAVTTLPPLGEGEAFAIFLTFRDGGVERYRGSGVAPPEGGANQTSGRAGKEAPKRRGVETRSLLLPFGAELTRANVPAAEERQRDDEGELGEGAPAVLKSLGEREKGG
jgi:hypothetical protein